MPRQLIVRPASRWKEARRDAGRERERVKNAREKHQDGRLSNEHSSISECQMTLLKGEELLLAISINSHIIITHNSVMINITSKSHFHS